MLLQKWPATEKVAYRPALMRLNWLYHREGTPSDSNSSSRSLMEATAERSRPEGDTVSVLATVQHLMREYQLRKTAYRFAIIRMESSREERPFVRPKHKSNHSALSSVEVKNE